ncbi:MAG: purine-nucleoside phosphorylase [Clostridiaceae bacterium]|nr:purine-nucleoside phosphorylase [Clostridiaceae bacterium]
MKNFSYDFYKESADYILEQISEKPKIAIILGSALGSIADLVENKTIVSYRDVPKLLQSTAPSHKGEFIFGRLSDQPVMLMSGRFHHYEGYSYEELAQPVRIMKLLGVETLIITNAAGAVNLDYEVGDVMLIEDQIKIAGHSPMRGPNIEEFGPRFFDCTYIYTPKLLKLAQAKAKELNYDNSVHTGVYYFCPGPNFETPAEIKAIRILGGDAVGMSTVTEALTAAHCEMDVLGISMITNMAAGIEDEEQSGLHVIDVGNKAASKIADLIMEVLKDI